MSAKPEKDATESNEESTHPIDNAPHALQEGAERIREKKARVFADAVAGRTRFVATVPSLGLFIASVVMAIGTFIDLVVSSYAFVIGESSLHELTIEYVEYADTFLLAVALYILSIGLLSLFVNEKIPLPSWLEFHDFDDLKERLTSVISVMIGVFFLGHVLKGGQGIETLWLGLGCAAIIIALSVFIRAAFNSEE
ncbi:YqhA family protein [Denitrobacterium detoxificans]|jgi:uncharacterized membrane protein YqhA|uniref:YqhA family protein n=1 Tax=Denitrobacterium detoxificans TaxID=79604 RepID=UPI0026EC7D67|nr:YqhA family protein [Denitrobacterium detoxificans]MBE6466481.1 YqhA family protein [Denitrobacterium detoxificans]